MSFDFKNFGPNLEESFVDFLDNVFQAEKEICLAALVKKLEFFIPGKKSNFSCHRDFFCWLRT